MQVIRCGNASEFVLTSGAYSDFSFNEEARLDV